MNLFQTQLFKKFRNRKSTRQLNSYRAEVDQINTIEHLLIAQSDSEIQAAVSGLRRELQGIASPQEQLDHLSKMRPQAFAIAKNAARRLCGREFDIDGELQTWQMIPYDVQLIGGIALAEGKLAEMHTGEGKTLAATLPTFLHALAGRGVHVITVNDYLAKRDATWMGKLFEFLGLSVGCLQTGQSPEQRRAAYACDITYGTASEFGFDYLRDQGLATSRNEQVQRERFFALIDEVDSVLIDEARTPLIIAGPSAHSSTDQFGQLKPAVQALVAAQKKQCEKLIRGGSLEELYQVQLAQPRHPDLLRLKEDPDTQRQLERIDLRYQVASNREDLVLLKENLYFTVDEKRLEAHLTERGRRFLSPEDPDAFTIQDLTESLSQLGSESERLKIEHAAAEQGERVHNIAQLLKAYCLYERDRDYLIEDGKVVIIDRQQDRKQPGRRWSDGLHQAVEAKEGVQVEQETETLASVTVQNYFRLYPRLSGMSGTVATESDEFEEIYDLGVVEVPPNRPSQREDLSDYIFKTRREKFNAIVAEIKQAHARHQPILLGTASVEESEVLSKMLKRAGLVHSVLNAKNHAQEAEIIARAGRAGSITVSTNMAGRGTDIALGEGVAGLGGLYVIGSERHESRRVDNQLRGRCARQGDPGMSRFFVSFEDPLMQHFGDTDRIIRLLGKVDLEPGNALDHPFLSRAISSAQKRVEASHFESRKQTLRYDNIVSQQRRAIYDRREALIACSDPAEKIGQQSRIDPDIERAIILRLIDEEWRGHLDALEELRDGMAFMHHAQKDPLLEYRHGALRLFQEMQKRIEWRVAEDFPTQRNEYQERRRQAEMAEGLIVPEIDPPRQERKVSRNAPCECGSGKKHKRCCGRG